MDKYYTGKKNIIFTWVFLLVLAYIAGVVSFGMVLFINDDKNIDTVPANVETVSGMGDKEKVVCAWITKTNRNVPVEVSELISKEICLRAKEDNVPISLLIAIIQRESYFNPMAVSKSGASGLMQVLNGGKGIVIDKARVFGISYNLKKGVEILKDHLKVQKGELSKALNGYVGGDPSYVNDIYRIIGEYDMFELDFKVEEIEEPNGIIIPDASLKK